MILYHGSNIKINQIDFTKCKPYKELTDQYSFHTAEVLNYLKGV